MKKLEKTRKRKQGKHGLLPWFFIALFCSIQLLFVVNVYGQQTVTVNGTVTDSEEQPLPGVNVIVKGTTRGTITNTDGNYSLSSISEDATLVFSFVGMSDQEMEVNGQTNINVMMVEKTTKLEEVVAIGYGTMKRVNLTGAVSQVQGDKLESRPLSNLGEGLQGLIPNLNIQVTSGDPTDDPTFNVRGFESINGGEPLILIDGVPGDPNNLNPNDIESVSVLKDAGASAIYGARGAFGVILFETKTPKRGRMNINFNVEMTGERPIWLKETVHNPNTFVTWINKAFERRRGFRWFDDFYEQRTQQWVENPTEDNAWGVHNGVLHYFGSNHYEDKIMKDVKPKEKYDLSVSGGTGDANYYASFGFLNEDGILKVGNSNFKRYNFLGKTNFKITNWLNIEQKIQFSSEVSDKPHVYSGAAEPIYSIIRTAPTRPLQFPDPKYFEDELPPSAAGRDYSRYVGLYMSPNTNALPYLEDGGRNTFENSDFTLSQSVIVNPLENLEFRGEFAYNVFNQRGLNARTPVSVIMWNASQLRTDITKEDFIGAGHSSSTFVTQSFNRNNYYVINAVGEYALDNKTSPHYFKALVGFNQEWAQNYGGQGQGRDLITGSVTALNATTGDQYAWDSKSHMALRGAFYRLNYIYNDKYLLELNGRYDGTSRFPKEDRFEFFPSASMGWRISEESFLAGWDFLSNLKIRASYGSLGNQNVASFYPYISTMSTDLSTYIMNGNRISTVNSPGLVSPSLTWEKVTTQNIGVDIGLLNNALSASFDTYIRKTQDMLMDVTYPPILGTSAPKENAADLKTIGWEFQVRYYGNVGRNWSYDIDFNVSDWTSEITKYENPTGAIGEYYVGQKINEIWGYETVGIFQSEDEVLGAADQSKFGQNWLPGDIHYKDLNGDGVIGPGGNTLDNPGDRKIIGNGTPRYSFGSNININYKDSWSLNVFFQGVGKRDYWPDTYVWNWFFPFNSFMMDEYFITESWSEDNRDAYFYAPSWQSIKNQQPQSRYLQDASYIRLKNIRLSYKLPQRILSTVGIVKQLRVYVSAMNLWEYSKMHKPLDPEYIYGRRFSVQYPLFRRYSVGINISL